MALNKRKVLDSARKHAQKGAKAKALKEYNKLLKLDPNDAKLLLEVGDAYRRWGQPEEAISQYSKVAGQYRQDGFDARAVAVFKQILNLDPKHYAAYVSLGELYQRMGLDSDAVAALQMAADGYHKEGKKREALDLLRQMAALDPSNTTSRLKVAELLRQEGMEDDAVAEYQAVAAELQSQSELDQLIVVQDRILEIRPEHVETLTSQVRNLMSKGVLDRAEPLAVRALNAAEDPAQYELLIELYAQMGQDAKLADATRGLAKLYRDRGDDDKARELMQRLPAEDVIAPEARLAVDASEVDEPELGDEELLDEPFLTSDDSFDLSSSSFGSGSLDTSMPEGDSGELNLDEVAEDNSGESSASLPLPEGDPDQLLAEANVYLRYGKRDQAIASLRSVISQNPNSRAALEKLGEAYAEDGKTSDAVQTWLKAAEVVRREGDAAALEILRDRIAALDPELASRVGQVDSSSGSAPESVDSLGSIEDAAGGVELELDVEVDLDLDDAIDEVAESSGNTGFGFAPESADAGESTGDLSDSSFEIDLDADSLVFGDAANRDVDAVANELSAEPTGASEAAAEEDDLELSVDLDLDGDPSADDEFERASGDSDFVDEDVDELSAIEFEIDTSDLSANDGVSTQGAASTEASDDEEIEVEIDFDDDLESSADSEEESADDEAPSKEKVAAKSKGKKATDAEEVNLDEEIEEAEFFLAQDMFDEAAKIISRILEKEPSHARALILMGEIAAARSGSAATDASEEAKTDRDSEGATGDAATKPELDATPEADTEPESEDLETSANEEPDSASEAEEAEVVEVEAVEAESEDDAAAAQAVEEEGADAAESFDLREALADVLDDEEASSRPDTSGVLSTVEDGFESIFSDFKKGVSATLDDGDYDTRYDLGIAYREMGLFDDAIGEFRVCLDSPTRRFDSLYLMGLCARDLSRWEDAVNHLEQALALPEIPEERLAGVYFDLSIAQEGAGDLGRASASVERVIELEPEFPGAADRIAALASGESSVPEVGEPGEAYESFDELFDGDEDDEGGDEEIAEAAPAEAFESFDDVVSEAEAVLDGTDLEAEPAPEPESGPEAETPNPSDSKKSGRKKISFV